MTLLVLDGKFKSSYIPLKKSYIFDGLKLHDPKMKTPHAQIDLDHNFSWKINALGGHKIRTGNAEVTTISLIPNLIFNIGGTGFKVLDRLLPSSANWETISADFIDSLHITNRLSSDFFFFLNPVQISFIQGPQADDIYTLSYGPRVMGYNQLDINIKDPNMPHEYFKFTQLGDKVLIEDLLTKKVYTLEDESLQIAFGSHVIEIKKLK